MVRHWPRLALVGACAICLCCYSLLHGALKAEEESEKSQANDAQIGETGCSAVEERAASGSWSAAQAEAVVAAIKPPQIPDQTVILTDLGASTSDVRPVLQTAISSMSQRGGGTVVVPDGLWLSNGPIHLESRVRLHLSAGAELRFLPDPSAYLPPVQTRWEGVEVMSHSPFIYGAWLEDVSITGHGIVNGQGKEYWLPWREKGQRDRKLLKEFAKTLQGVRELTWSKAGPRVFGQGHYLRPPLIQFYSCSRVLVDGPRIRDCPFWCIHPVLSNNVIVRNVDIVSHHVNSDGIDPDSSSQVLVERSRFNVGDDGVAVKSGRDGDGRRVGQPSEDIIIRDCVYVAPSKRAVGGAVTIGSEMSGGVRRVFVSNISITVANHAIYVKSNPDRGGYIEDVIVQGVSAETLQGAFIMLTQRYGRVSEGGHVPRMQGLTVSSSTCSSALVAFHSMGVKKSGIQEIFVKDVQVHKASRRLQVANTSEVCFNGFLVEGVQLLSPWSNERSRSFLALRN